MRGYQLFDKSQLCPRARPGITLMRSPHLPPLLGLCSCWGGGLQKSFLFIVVTAAGGGGVWGWQMGSFCPPFKENGLSPLQGGGFQESRWPPPASSVPRWLPPLPCSDVKEPPRVTGGAGHREPGVYCPSPQGCPGEIFFLAKSSEDGERGSPGGEGPSITEWSFWELPGDPKSGAEATCHSLSPPPPHQSPTLLLAVRGVSRLRLPRVWRPPLAPALVSALAPVPRAPHGQPVA